MPKVLTVLLCALVATGFSATASTAATPSDGVVVDPGSPTGKEYALPVDRARQQAAKGKRTTGGSKSPLFGEGVGNDAAGAPPATPSTGDQGSAAAKAKAKRKSREAAARKAAKAAARDAAVAAADKARARAQAASDAAARTAELARARALRAQATTPDGGLGVGGIIAVGVAVLLVGGLIGLWLRRRAQT